MIESFQLLQPMPNFSLVCAEDDTCFPHYSMCVTKCMHPSSVKMHVAVTGT